jgi:hypothetical protein
MYLTYEEYQNMGGTLNETAFADFEFEARTQVDWYTFTRLQNETELPEAVKRCVYALIRLLQDKQQAMVVGGTSADGTVQAGIASQSNDGVSVSFNTLSARDLVDMSKDAIESTVQRYLQGVTDSLGRKVLYRGVYPNE